MNAFSQIASAYEPLSYADWSYIMTAADFADGCAIRTDALSGRQWGVGLSKLGSMIAVPLNVPLCQGCDGLIVDHLCTDCCVLFIGEPQEQMK